MEKLYEHIAEEDRYGCLFVKECSDTCCYVDQKKTYFCEDLRGPIVYRGSNHVVTCLRRLNER